jgi:alkaline phosphatase
VQQSSTVASAETQQEMLPPDENTWKITFAGQVAATREEAVATETGDDGEIPAGNAVWIGSRTVLTQEDATDPDFLQQALIPRSSETHSGEDVAIYASGPWAHLFDGTVEQNYIFHVMQHAASAE